MTRARAVSWKVAAAVAGLLVCAAWGLAPLDRTVTAPAPPPPGPGASTAASGRTFDVAAFSRPLWPPPPEPAKAPPPPPPPPAAPDLTVQLIAISGTEDARTAILYDPAGDALRTVSVGDTINRRTVTRITADAIDLTLPAPHNTTATLALKPAVPATGGKP